MKLDLNSMPKDSACPVIDPSIPYDQYCKIDLSKSNKKLEDLDVSSSASWEEYIDTFLSEKGKSVAYGGYLEKREIYERSFYFKNQKTDRNIHLGVDFWAPAETSVHAALKGTIKSLQNNQNYGDYGPTIILEHQFEKQTFYTLYGHLSLKSIEALTVGQKIDAGELIGWLGDSSVNGDYAPHLHFQTIINLEEKLGDYPGVCSSENLEWFSKNCPNPLALFDI